MSTLTAALKQTWWAPLAALLAVSNVATGIAIVANEQNPGSLVGSSFFVAGAIALVAGLLMRATRPDRGSCADRLRRLLGPADLLARRAAAPGGRRRRGRVPRRHPAGAQARGRYSVAGGMAAPRVRIGAMSDLTVSGVSVDGRDPERLGN
jgi:hypothetical protein